MKSKVFGIILLLLGIAALGIYVGRGYITRRFFAPQTQPNARQLVPVTQTSSPSPALADRPAPGQPIPDVEIVAENLNIPWEIAFLPEGDMLVTQRPGTLLRIGKNQEAIPVSGVHHIGEGGLLGMALHPNFTQNHFIYVYVTTDENGGVTNRVERYELAGTQLSKRSMIIENIPGASYHDGGRMAFGPDGKLYITTGDAGTEKNAQDTDSLAGKILRLNDDGTIPVDNPFRNAVYSYGHRNPQGLVWDEAGNLWATEHGRSGAASGYDELNRIEKGKNYGWPEIQGDETKPGMVSPVAHSGPDVTWAPSGIAFYNGSLLFAGLRGESLYKADPKSGEITAYVADEFGRLRTVKVGPDGLLYILTNNTDGRGNPRPNDDKIIRLNPAILN